MIQIEPNDPRPIWSQIEESMRALVAAQALTVGAAVPSVRDLARELRVNPATVAKAYQQLVAAGLFEVRRGEGTFVASTPRRVSTAARARSLDEAATRYARLALDAGAERSEALDRVAAAWDQISTPTTTPAATAAGQREPATERSR